MNCDFLFLFYQSSSFSMKFSNSTFRRKTSRVVDQFEVSLICLNDTKLGKLFDTHTICSVDDVIKGHDSLFSR